MELTGQCFQSGSYKEDLDNKKLRFAATSNKLKGQNWRLALGSATVTRIDLPSKSCTEKGMCLSPMEHYQ